MAKVAVVGGSEETRLLLRGLLRLHRHQVVQEGPTLECLERLPPATLQGPLVLVVDANLDEGSWGERAGRVLHDHPHVRGVLLSPSRSSRVENQAKSAGFAAVVRRPFSMQELVAAVEPPAEPPFPSPGAPEPAPTGRDTPEAP